KQVLNIEREAQALEPAQASSGPVQCNARIDRCERMDRPNRQGAIVLIGGGVVEEADEAHRAMSPRQSGAGAPAHRIEGRVEAPDPGARRGELVVEAKNAVRIQFGVKFVGSEPQSITKNQVETAGASLRCFFY